MAKVLVVPGLAVQGYAEAAARAARERGHAVDLLPAPAWRGVEAGIGAYGRRLGEGIEGRGEEVSLLVGLSVGTQAAALAAERTSLVRRLLLVSPMVDPRKRSRRRLLAAWLFGDQDDAGPGLRSQIPDWARAGPWRILRGFDSALRYPLEAVLPGLGCEIAIVHAGRDSMSGQRYATRLAAESGAKLLLIPDAPHSWPFGDPLGFADLADELASGD